MNSLKIQQEKEEERVVVVIHTAEKINFFKEEAALSRSLFCIIVFLKE